MEQVVVPGVVRRLEQPEDSGAVIVGAGHEVGDSGRQRGGVAQRGGGRETEVGVVGTGREEEQEVEEGAGKEN